MTLTTNIPSRAQQPQWFVSWFDSPYYHRLYADRDAHEAAAFVNTLVRELCPPRGARALDLGCGAGRHARQLAARGLRVTGMDLAASSIHDARRFASDSLHFVRHDMRVPFGVERFDYVFSFFTSFGYFDSPTEHRRVVRNMARSLSPGGRLVLDYLNVAQAQQGLQPYEERAIDGVVYRITRWTDTRHFYKRIVVGGDGEAPIEHVERVAKFGIDDFRRMFEMYGLRIDAVFGDYGLGAYSPAASPRLIMFASRTGRADGALVPAPCGRRTPHKDDRGGCSFAA